MPTVCGCAASRAPPDILLAMTKHIRPLASLAALLALALGVRALGLPHPGPPVNLEFAIAPDRISLRVVGEQARAQHD